MICKLVLSLQISLWQCSVTALFASQAPKLNGVKITLPLGHDAVGSAPVLGLSNTVTDTLDQQLADVASQLRVTGFALVDTSLFPELQNLLRVTASDLPESPADRLQPDLPAYLTEWAAFTTRLLNINIQKAEHAALFAIPTPCIQFRGDKFDPPVAQLHIDAGRGHLHGITGDHSSFPFGAFNAWWTYPRSKKQLVLLKSHAQVGRPPSLRAGRSKSQRWVIDDLKPDTWQDVCVSPKELAAKRQVLLFWSLLSPGLIAA